MLKEAWGPRRVTTLISTTRLVVALLPEPDLGWELSESTRILPKPVESDSLRGWWLMGREPAFDQSAQAVSVTVAPGTEPGSLPSLLGPQSIGWGVPDAPEPQRQPAWP